MTDSVAARESSVAFADLRTSAELQQFLYEILSLKSRVIQKFATLSVISFHFQRKELR
jgi:hypothetical protein